MGKLTKVCVRKKWPNEAKDFTPCLSKNLNLLSDVLGMGLELVGTEVEAGPYKADIEARIPTDGARVIIENQLTRADPRHLGQLLNYHVRLKAQKSVWVATDFWGTNLSVIRWLNRQSGDSFSFFAVRVSVYRDQNSILAPVFEVIEYPNGWEDPRASKFWAHFAARRQGAPKGMRGSSCRRVRHMVKEADLKIVQYFRPDSVRVYLTGNWNEADKDVFSRIGPYWQSLKAALRDSGFLGGKNFRCTTQLRIDTHDRDNWDKMADWLDEQRIKYESVLRNGPTVTT